MRYWTPLQGCKVQSVRMSREQGNSSRQSASDAEFRATFSLLPHVNSILASLGQGDNVAVEKTVGELETQLRRCQQLLSGCPYLDLSAAEQTALLQHKRKLLHEKSELLMNYSDLAVLASR